MAITKVWNITDRPGSKIPPTTMIVLGKTLLPGRSVQVDDRDLDRAHKLRQEIAGGFLAISPDAPTHQAVVKASLPKGMARSHGTKEAKPEDVKEAAKLEESKPEEKSGTETSEEPEVDKPEGGRHGKKRWER